MLILVSSPKHRKLSQSLQPLHKPRLLIQPLRKTARCSTLIRKKRLSKSLLCRNQSCFSSRRSCYRASPSLKPGWQRQQRIAQPVGPPFLLPSYKRRGPKGRRLATLARPEKNETNTTQCLRLARLAHRPLQLDSLSRRGGKLKTVPPRAETLLSWIRLGVRALKLMQSR